MPKTLKENKQENKEKITEVVFILDRSGSMRPLEKDTIDGFNGFIKEQKTKNNNTLVTTVLFADNYEMIHNRTNINEVKELTENEYFTYGMTALLDAIGNTISLIKGKQMYGKSIFPENTIFVITTDGQENYSRKYNYREIKRMISEMQEMYGWEFIFLADNIDAAQTAEDMGIKRDKAMNYNSKYETRTMFDSVAMYCDMEPEERKSVAFTKVFNKAKNKEKDNK